jgi:hypothetical protein
MDEEKKVPLCQYRIEQNSFLAGRGGFRRRCSDLVFLAEV